MKMTAESGYEITVTPSERYPKHWFIATAFNPNIKTSCWGHGETEISALHDCMLSISNGEIFEGDLAVEN